MSSTSDYPTPSLNQGGTANEDLPLDLNDPARPLLPGEFRAFCIICNDRAIEVIPNFRYALHSFATPNICGWVWIDAFCIRQHDLEERVSRVTPMGKTCSRAAEVLIWPAHETDLSSSFVKTTQNVAPLVLQAVADGPLPERELNVPFPSGSYEEILGVKDFATILLK
ncbi:uncharacterized protein A1O5_09253 [Cladophialophora psammophila CBS 110553]|uniref:Heterokaryon incompatibility domain-containing protein n=1 Tax=Cladophialophora psammophila CBS 110553 TaxID=1182543 RepID=W9WTF3_9EURO|nr:uncharacterized protein A1O5_09253 [Cladophialophora psammophila CBS 110553]EXJ67906.1 hypothetical protein A1O5_09253 [Cladophialophora psammophila CBS 110553]